MDTERKPKLSIRLAWLFGLFNKDIIRAKKKQPEQEHKRKEASSKLRTTFYVLRTEGLVVRLFKLAKSILRCIKIQDLGSDLKIALDNPADTGILFSMIAPINLLIRSCSPHQIVIEPSFDDDAFLKGYFSGKARMQPIRLLPPILNFVLSSPAIRALKALISLRWKEKRR